MDFYASYNGPFPMTPRQHIRKRPGMYIGGTDARALHHLVYAELYHSRNKRKFPIILPKDGEEVGDAIERIQHAVNEMEERDVATLAQTNLNDLTGRLLVGVTPENLSTQLEKIIEALDKNADWVRTHKQISNAAFRWEVAQRDPAFLIVGQARPRT